MPLVPMLPPQPVPVFSGFDYVTVDAARRRVYAAHGGSRALLIVDADSGKVLGQVRVGGVRGIAVDPQSGHVYTGNGEARSVSEVDPVAMKVVQSIDVPGEPDALAYDTSNGRIYVDEDNGTHIYVIDAKSFKQIASIDLPGHKPEYLAVDERSHDLYQNIDDTSEVVVIDAATMKVKQHIPTPEITHNHPLQFDTGLGHLYVAGTNGVLSVYDRSGKLLYKAEVPKSIDQCDLDARAHHIACASREGVFMLEDSGTALRMLAAPQIIARGVHTLAIDPKTNMIWVVWASPEGDFVQPFKVGS